MSTVGLNDKLVAASPDEVSKIKTLSDALSSNAGAGGIRYFLSDSTGKQLELPKSIFGLLAVAAQEMAQGHSVVIAHYDHELTTQEAADLMQVSRPYLIQLLEKGHIPFRLVGTHRRIRMGELLAYKKHRDNRRREGLQELQRVSDALGLYESDDGQGEN